MVFYYPDRPWLVDAIIPEQSFTLIGGRSGSGKSTIVLQGIEEWIQRQTFLGNKCNRTPVFHFIAFDRSLRVIYQHLNTLGMCFYNQDMDQQVIFHSAAIEDYGKKDFTLPKVNHGDVVVIDGLDMLTMNVKDFGPVKTVCSQCLNLIENLGISIIGLIGAIKSNGNGKDDSSPWDKLLGSGVWQRISETNMLIEPVNCKEIENPNRILYIRPRFSNALRMFYAFQKDSRLHPIANPESLKTPEGFLRSLPDGRIFTAQEAIQIGQTNDISRATVYRLIDYIVDEKKWVSKISMGKFKKNLKVN